MPKNSNNMLPPMDIDEDILNPINKKLYEFYEKNSIEPGLNSNIEKCPFIEKRSTSIRSDGALSPCLPFMHKHQVFFENRSRTIEPYIIGNINQTSLRNLWDDFDCFSNTSPACGGCLWEQGFIRCP